MEEMNLSDVQNGFVSRWTGRLSARRMGAIMGVPEGMVVADADEHGYSIQEVIASYMIDHMGYDDAVAWDHAQEIALIAEDRRATVMGLMEVSK